ncbi:solute carrier organic anion transporter family member 2B1 X3 [Biomphalaria glabrata]|nr:solute carrier organic anion transporter family member 2B1 X3 [Biomphalaria glabrata]
MLLRFEDSGDESMVQNQLQATSDESTTAVLELFQLSPQKSSRQAARESDVSASSVLHILRKGKFGVYIPRLVQQLNLSGHFGTMYGSSVGSYSAMLAPTQQCWLLLSNVGSYSAVY